MPEEYKIDFPETIRELAEKLFSEEIRKKNEKLQKRMEEESKKAAIVAERIALGAPYAEKIFKWTKAFRESDIGKKLMEISHIPTAYKFVFFFTGKAEGKEWTGIGVSCQKGVLWGHERRYELHHYEDTPEELAGNIDPDILKLACEWIDDGRVWKRIEEGFDYLKPEVHERHIRKMNEMLQNRGILQSEK